jgi:hypothetical protein
MRTRCNLDFDRSSFGGHNKGSLLRTRDRTPASLSIFKSVTLCHITNNVTLGVNLGRWLDGFVLEGGDCLRFNVGGKNLQTFLFEKVHQLEHIVELEVESIVNSNVATFAGGF